MWHLYAASMSCDWQTTLNNSHQQTVMTDRSWNVFCQLVTENSTGSAEPRLRFFSATSWINVHVEILQQNILYILTLQFFHHIVLCKSFALLLNMSELLARWSEIQKATSFHTFKILVTNKLKYKRPIHMYTIRL